VVKERSRRDQDTLNEIKRNFLQPETGMKGVSNRTIDIQKLLN